MNVPKRRLLLADDSITIQKVVNLTFAEEGIDVTAVGDGDAALEYLSRETPDLVMADVNMPGANGYQICEAIRSYEVTRAIPVVLLVGSFEPFDEAEAERVGASAFMTKPFQSIRQLVATITEMMEATAPASQVDHVPLAEQETVELPEELPIEEAPATVEYREDIDSLYTHSVATEDTTDFAFVGDELDDEMMETSYTEQEPASVDFDLPNVAETDDAEGNDVVEIDTSQYYTETLTAAETVELQASDLPALDVPGYVESEFAHIPEETPVYDIPQEPVYEQPEPTPAYTEYEFESTAVEDAEAPVAVAGFDRSLHLVEPSAPQTQPLEPIQTLHAVEPVIEEDPSPVVEQFPAQRPDPFETKADDQPIYDTAIASTIVDLPPASFFEEVNLLDLPPAGDNQTIEFTTTVLADDAGSNKQVVSVSPELMEIIVQKVLERLQQK